MYEENYNRVTYRFNWGGKMTPMVRALLIITCAVFALQIFTGGRPGGVDVGALFGLSVAYFRPWQLITSTFLHASVFQFLFNMLWFWVLGKDVERSVGTKKFLALYLAGGVTAGLCWLAIAAVRGGAASVTGASGAVFAVLVAFALLYPDRRFLVFKAKYFIAAVIAFWIVMSFAEENGGVANLAPLGGAAFGLIFLKGAPAFDSLVNRRRNGKGMKQHKNEARIRVKVDALLEKISAHGLDSLTSSEKSFLKKASRRFKRNHHSPTGSQDRDFVRRK